MILHNIVITIAMFYRYPIQHPFDVSTVLTQYPRPSVVQFAATQMTFFPRDSGA